MKPGSNDTSNIGEQGILAGGGEAGERIRAKDWSKTPLGPVEHWPQSLRSALSICLGSAFPIAIYWGPELTLLYNDAWSPIPGNKHPQALGKPAIEVWPEIWEDIDPLFQKVFETGEAVRNIDELLPMQRHGYTEECYFDFTFTPVRGEKGNVEGIFNSVIETTYRYINERRNNILRKVSNKMNQATSVSELFSLAKAELENAVEDVPFSLIYLNSNNDAKSILISHSGPEVPSPDIIELSSNKETAWPFAEIMATGNAVLKSNASLFGQTVKSAWSEPSTEALIIPFGLNKTTGFFVAGINPRRALDSDYQNFLETIASHYSNTLYQIRTLEQERKRAESLSGIIAQGVEVTEQVLARHKIAESEEKYRSLFEKIEEGFSIIEIILKNKNEPIDYKFLENNPAFEKQTGLKNAEGKAVRQVVPDLEQHWFQRFGEVALTGKSSRFTERSDTIGRWFDVHAFKLGGPESLKVAIFFSDITQRIKSEQALRNSENRFRQIIRGLPVAFYTCDAEGRIEMYNDDAVKLWGREPEVGKDLWCGSWKIYTPEGKPLPLEKCPMALVIKEDSIQRGKEILIEQPGGKRISVLVYPQPIYDAEGKKTGAINILADIGPVKEAEQALRRSEQRFKTFIEAMPQMAFMSDAKGQVIYHNRQWSEYLGKSLYPENIETSFSQMLHPDDLKPTMTKWEDSLNTGKPYFMECRLIRHDGQYHWHLSRALPIKSSAGKIEMWLGTSTDIHEQKQAEQALQQIKDQLTITLENVPSGIVLFNKDGGIVFCNQLGAYFQGYDTASELIAQKNIGDVQAQFLKNFIVEDEQGNPISTEKSVVLRALKGEENCETIAHYFDKQKQTDRWVLVRANPILDEEGKVKLALLSITDISAQKRAEVALRKSEEYYKTMTDNTPVMTWITRPNGKISFFNKPWYEYTGQTVLSGLGFGWLDAVHPDDRERARHIFLGSNKERIPFTVEYRLRYRDGQYRWHITSALPKFDDEGSYEGHIGSVTDIHERKIAEQRLRDSEENLKLAVLVSDMGTWEFRPKSGQIFWSDRCKELFGLRPDVKVDYQLFLEGLHPDDRELVFLEGRKAMKSKDLGKIDLEFRTLGIHDKEVRWVKAKGHAYFDDQGAAVKLLGTIVDITMQREAEEALNQSHDRLQKLVKERTRELVAANKSLQRSNSELNRFAYVTSHDLKAPLRGISTIAAWLKEDYGDKLDEAGQEQLKMMQQRVKRMYNLIDGILSYSRAGRSEEHVPTLVNLNNLIEEITMTLAVPSDFKIHYNGTLPSVNFDSVKLYQVFQNLISNAIKFNDKPKGAIIIEFIEKDTEYIFMVRDNGPGIPEKYQRKIFELFQTLEADSEEKSTGLGLAIIKKIIEVEGGRIWLESKEGEGAAFYFTIPKRIPKTSESKIK
ncbi:MAG: PAS domain S-box protein [Bacteroidia bacterium]